MNNLPIRSTKQGTSRLESSTRLNKPIPLARQWEDTEALTLWRMTMPWYAWLILILAIGSIVGGLMLLRDTAKPLPLTKEQLKRIHDRNLENDAKDAQDR